jgi:hypothetical protein
MKLNCAAPSYTAIAVAALISACASGANSPECAATPEFKIIDNNSDCHLASDEWASMIRRGIDRLPPSDARIQFERAQLALFDQLDANHDGVIDADEWKKGNFNTTQTIEIDDSN